MSKKHQFRRRSALAAGTASRSGIRPCDETNMDEMCGCVSEPEISAALRQSLKARAEHGSQSTPPADASQNQRNDQRAVTRSASWSLYPGPRPRRMARAIASATANATTIHSVVVGFVHVAIIADCLGR